MGRIIAVASGKGGVGKSTVSVQLAGALGRLGRQVLLIDGDLDMRCLDLMLSLTDSLAFDLSDVLSGNKPVQEVILHSKAFGVSLLPAPLDGKVDLQKFRELITALSDTYDFIIIDLPAGNLLEKAVFLPHCCEGLVVCKADSIAMRSAEKTVAAFRQYGVVQVRLVINRFCRENLKHGVFATVDDMIDAGGARLIALIPESRALYRSTLLGKPMVRKCPALRAFDRFARRLLGYTVPFSVKML